MHEKFPMFVANFVVELVEMFRSWLQFSSKEKQANIIAKTSFKEKTINTSIYFVFMMLTWKFYFKILWFLTASFMKLMSTNYFHSLWNHLFQPDFYDFSKSELPLQILLIAFKINKLFNANENFVPLIMNEKSFFFRAALLSIVLIHISDIRTISNKSCEGLLLNK